MTASVRSAAIGAAIAAYLAHLDVERGLAANTLAAYRRDLDRWAAYLARKGIDAPEQVSEAAVADFLAEIRTGGPEQAPLAATSAARCLIAVRGWHRFLTREGELASDPSAGIRPPPPPARLPKALSVDAVERLLGAAAVGDTPSAMRDRALLEFLYGTGARISEAVGTDIDDLADDAVRLRGKGGKQRLVPLGSYARDALAAYLTRARPVLAESGRTSAAVFLNTRGKRLSRQSAWALLRVIAQRAHLEGQLSPHTLRHSFATHLMEGGADVRVVQELLGHASVTTTQIYTAVTISHLREVYSQSHPRAR